MSTFMQDIRYAVRTLSKAPGFTAVVVIILAIGIGANVAMFSITDAVMLRSLPFRDSDELILGRTTYSGEIGWNVSAEDYFDFRDRVQAFESLAAVRSAPDHVTITGGERPELAPAILASVNFFSTLGIAPQSGRQFTSEERELSAPDVVIISHGYWQRRFGGAPDALGKTLVINGVPNTVVGVMPAGFRFLFDVDIWAPMRDGGPYTGFRQYHNWTLVGRLQPDVTLEQAQSQVDVVALQLQQAYPESNEDKGLNVSGLQGALVEYYRPTLLMLMAAIALVLLIACGNVAGLLLARGSNRTTEMAVRAAMGASGRRIARLLLTESALMAVVAGLLGIVTAVWLQRLMLGFIQFDYLGITEIGMSAPMVLFATALSLLTALMFGVAPAVSGARTSPAENLKSGARITGSGGAARLRSGLVILQVALSVVLLIGAGLLLRSFVRLRRVDPGFQTENLLTARVSLPPARYEDGESRVQFYEALLQEIRAIPGVQSVVTASALPIKDHFSRIRAWNPENPPARLSDRRAAEHRRVLPGYFEAIGIPILAGRDVEPTDAAGSEPVIILSETMARDLFQDQNPLGRQVALDWGREEPVLLRVVGIAGDVQMTSLSSENYWQMYYSYRQSPVSSMSLAIRAQGDPAALTHAIRRAVQAQDPDLPLFDVSTMEEEIASSVSDERVIMLTVTLYAALAMVLAAIGLYSVLAFYVAQRVHEIGIRMALGATAGNVVRLVLQRGVIMVGIGLAVGIAGAVGATRLIQQQLFDVAPTDPMTFAGVVVLFALVGIAACVIPAWRAVRLDPVETLQAE
jgi:putative ABC transport system permease protein